MNEEDLVKVRKCACANLRAVTRVVTQAYDDALEPSGLTCNQFTLLAAIEREGTVTISQLAAKLWMDATTITRTLKPLLKQQLVQNSPGEDQRTRNLTITEKGRQTFAEAFPLWEKLQHRVTEQLGQQKFDAFLQELFAVADLLH